MLAYIVSRHTICHLYCELIIIGELSSRHIRSLFSLAANRYDTDVSSSMCYFRSSHKYSL